MNESSSKPRNLENAIIVPKTAQELTNIRKTKESSKVTKTVKGTSHNKPQFEAPAKNPSTSAPKEENKELPKKSKTKNEFNETDELIPEKKGNFFHWFLPLLLSVFVISVFSVIFIFRKKRILEFHKF